MHLSQNNCFRMASPPNMGSPLKNSKQPPQWKNRGQNSQLSSCTTRSSPVPWSSHSHMPFDCTNSKTAESKDLRPHGSRYEMLKKTVQCTTRLHLQLQNSCLFCIRSSRIRSVPRIFEQSTSSWSRVHVPGLFLAHGGGTTVKPLGWNMVFPLP